MPTIPYSGKLGTGALGSFILGGLAPGSDEIDDRLLVQMAEDGDFRAWVFVVAEYWLRLIENLRQVKDAFDATDLSNVAGVALDVLGSIVGLPRQGYGDIRYRSFLKIQIYLILTATSDTPEWTGTVANVLRIIREFKGGTAGDGTIDLRNTPPYAYILDIQGLAIADIELMARFVRLATYAGVLGYVYVALADYSVYDSVTAGPSIPDTGVYDSVTAGLPISNTATYGATILIGTSSEGA